MTYIDEWLLLNNDKLFINEIERSNRKKLRKCVCVCVLFVSNIYLTHGNIGRLLCRITLAYFVTMFFFLAVELWFINDLCPFATVFHTNIHIYLIFFFVFFRKMEWINKERKEGETEKPPHIFVVSFFFLFFFTKLWMSLKIKIDLRNFKNLP